VGCCFCSPRCSAWEWCDGWPGASCRAGALFAAYLGLQGLTLLLVEPLQGDSLLLPYGVRAAQPVGPGLALVALLWLRAHGIPAEPPTTTAEDAGLAG
jgi:hypothetical protein